MFHSVTNPSAEEPANDVGKFAGTYFCNVHCALKAAVRTIEPSLST